VSPQPNRSKARIRKRSGLFAFGGASEGKKVQPKRTDVAFSSVAVVDVAEDKDDVDVEFVEDAPKRSWAVDFVDAENSAVTSSGDVVVEPVSTDVAV